MGAKRKLKGLRGRSCPYCGLPFIDCGVNHPRFPTKDHLNPRFLGGGPTIIVCRECNNLKDKMPLEDWLVFLMKERPKQIAPTMAELRHVRHMLFVPKESDLREVLVAAQEFVSSSLTSPVSYPPLER